MLQKRNVYILIDRGVYNFILTSLNKYEKEMSSFILTRTCDVTWDSTKNEKQPPMR